MAKPAGLSDDDIVQKAVSSALEQFKKFAPEEFKQLAADPKKKEEFTAVTKKAAEDEVKQARDLRGHVYPESDIATRLGKCLPQAHIRMVEKGLTIQTYKIGLNRRTDGHVWAEISRDGKEFMPSIKLDTLQAINTASWLQIASIIVEAVLLVLTAVGITIEVSNAVIEQVSQEVVTVVESSSLLQKAVQQLEEAFASGSAMDKAKAIFYLIKDTKSAGILWQIIKGLCKNMSWWDWTKTAGIVTAMIVAAIATDGVALIAKIVLALKSAYDFIQKVTNMTELRAMKK